MKRSFSDIQTLGTISFLLSAPLVAHPKSPIIFFLHGYGSNEEDLLDLAEGMPPEFHIVSLRAPYRLGEEQFAWFALDHSSGVPRGDKQEADASRMLIARSIAQIVSHVGADPARVTLLGFSQGAMESLAVALTFPGLVQGVVALSGRVFPEIKPLVHVSEKLRALRVFIGHGTDDEVIPIRYARDAKAYLEDLGVELSYHEYEAPHTITREEKADIHSWLSA